MPKSALLVVDVQNDFCPGGSLAVREGDRVVAPLNEYARRFAAAGLPVFASRDFHPERTRHFKEYGGSWPPHCVQGTKGAEFHPDLELPPGTHLVSKGSRFDEDAYSSFEGRGDDGRPLAEALRQLGVERLYVGGLATDYCVRASVLEALRKGFEAVVLVDAVRGVDLKSGDSERALDEMIRAGADTTRLGSIESELRG